MRFRTLFTVVALGVAMFTAFSGTASATSLDELMFQIRPEHSGKCLDVQGGPAALENGAQVQQWTCLGNQWTNQRWRLIETGVGGTYRIQAVHSGKCLDVAGGTASTGDGAKVQQWTCLGNEWSNQRWSLTRVNPNSNYYRIQPAHSGKCLDVLGGPAAISNGDKVQQWTCLAPSQTNQNWLLYSS